MPKGKYSRSRKAGDKTSSYHRKNHMNTHRVTTRKVPSAALGSRTVRDYSSKATRPLHGSLSIETSSKTGRTKITSKNAPADKKASKPKKRAKPTGKNYRKGGKTVSMKKGSSKGNPGKSQARMKRTKSKK